MAGHTQQHEENSGHHGAHKQAVDPMLGDNASHDHTNAPWVRQSVS